MKRISAAVVLAATCLGLFSGGCGPPEKQADSVFVNWQFDPMPARVGPVDVIVSLADSTGRAVTGAEAVLEATMTHPGMQPSQARLEEADPGSYRGTIEFTMAGDWVLLLEAQRPDGSTLRREHLVPGVRPN